MQTYTFNPGLAYAEYNQRKVAYIIAAIVAFTMSSYFVVGYLAGNLLFWTWDISQGMNGAVGVGLCFVMTAYQFILYSQGDVKGGKKATIAAVCVAVGFSLLSEVGQGMERDHVRMETRSIESPTYKAIVGKIGNATGATAHPYSADLKHAEMKLARCQQKVNAGAWTDCIESTARLNSVKSMIQQHYQQSQQHAVTLANTAKTMEKDESNYHPLVNLIKGIAGSTGVVASFILSLVLISFFEYAFHYLGRQLAEARQVLLGNGYDVTRRNRKTPKALNKLKVNNAPSLVDNTWNDELSKSGLDSPDDEVLNQSADGEQVKRIIDRATRVADQPDARESESRATPDATSDTPCTVHGEQPFTNDLYQQLTQLVICGDVAPTFRPVKEQLKTWSVGTSDRNRQGIASNVLDKMAGQGILKLNTQTGGIKQAKYVLADKYRNKVLGSSDEQLNMPLSREGVVNA